MSPLQGIALFISLVFSLPIYLYLFYKILEAVQASELMWFLFYAYIPLVVIGSVVSKLLEWDKKK